MGGTLQRHSFPRGDSAWDSELCLIRADDRAGLTAAIDEAIELTRRPGATLARIARTLLDMQPAGPACLSVVASDPEQFAKKARHARKLLARADRRRIQDRSGIFYTDTPIYRPGRMGFLFPGEGCQYPGMLRELCLHFPEVRQEFDLVDRACRLENAGFTPSAHIFGESALSADDALYTMGAAVEAVSAADSAMMKLFRGLRVPVDAVIGHSSGEYVALEMSGILRFADPEEHLQLIRDGYRNIQALENATNLQEGRLIAVGGTDESHIRVVLDDYPGQIFLAMHNCPHQFVLCTEPALLDTVCAALGGKGAIVQPLPFHRPYHTPWFEPALDGLRSLFAGRRLHAPTARLYSCATASPFPDDPEGILDLCVVQWTSRVRFSEAIEAMYRDGVRVFLDVGPRGNLAAFVRDILTDQPHVAVAANRQHRSSTTQLHHALGELAAHGVPIHAAFLHQHRGTKPLVDPISECRTHPELELAPGLPRLGTEDLSIPKRSAPSAPPPGTADRPPASSPSDGAAVQAYFDTMDRFIDTQRNLVSRFLDEPDQPDA